MSFRSHGRLVVAFFGLVMTASCANVALAGATVTFRDSGLSATAQFEDQSDIQQTGKFDLEPFVHSLIASAGFGDNAAQSAADQNSELFVGLGDQPERPLLGLAVDGSANATQLGSSSASAVSVFKVSFTVESPTSFQIFGSVAADPGAQAWLRIKNNEGTSVFDRTLEPDDGTVLFVDDRLSLLPADYTLDLTAIADGATGFGGARYIFSADFTDASAVPLPPMWAVAGVMLLSGLARGVVAGHRRSRS